MNKKEKMSKETALMLFIICYCFFGLYISIDVLIFSTALISFLIIIDYALIFITCIYYIHTKYKLMNNRTNDQF